MSECGVVGEARVLGAPFRGDKKKMPMISSSSSLGAMVRGRLTRISAKLPEHSFVRTGKVSEPDAMIARGSHKATEGRARFVEMGAALPGRRNACGREGALLLDQLG